MVAATYAYEEVSACGIVGYMGKDPAVSYLLEGLHILQNRGYDSAGIATIHKENTGESSVKVTKVFLYVYY